MPAPRAPLSTRVQRSRACATILRPTPAPLGRHGRHDIVSFARDRVAAELTAVGAPSYGLALIPGFDSTFVASMSRAAQVMQSYGAADIFCFSWPSQGKLDLPSYKADRDAAIKSADAIADSLRKLFAVLMQLKSNLPVFGYCYSFNGKLCTPERGATNSCEGTQ